MIQIFKTKADVNGNVYYLIVDHEKKNFKLDYNCMMFSNEYILTVTKRERKRYAEYLLNEGYNELY